MARANGVARPIGGPVKERTLTGVLAWRYEIAPNTEPKVKMQIASLTLKQADGQVVPLGKVETLPKGIDYSKYIGKQVEVKVMGSWEGVTGKPGVVLLVEKITDIKEVAPAKP
jgi:hypothetical protein